jgi:type I restriction enzyme, S subunit
MSRWPVVPLSELLRLSLDKEMVMTDQVYPTFGVYGFGRGLFTKEPLSGSAISAKYLFPVRRGQFIYSRLKAFEGAYGLFTDEFDGCYVTNEFPSFDCDASRLLPDYVTWYFRSPSVWESASRFSTGIGARRERLQLEQFLTIPIPLPPLTEQRRLIESIDDLAAKLAAAEATTTDIANHNQHLLRAAFHRLVHDAPRRRLGEIAPLTRRPAAIDPFQEYPQVSVRSFGRGTFHNPPLKGSEITWEKPHLVKAGDILISNIKAWEGAIAVARVDDDQRYGSHRYLTYVPVPGVATARFICFFLLSPEGLHYVGEASPGSADRNRTTGAKALLEIQIPVPRYEQQIWFGELYEKVEAMRRLQIDVISCRNAMLPAVLDGAFRAKR